MKAIIHLKHISLNDIKGICREGDAGLTNLKDRLTYEPSEALTLRKDLLSSVVTLALIQRLPESADASTLRPSTTTAEPDEVIDLYISDDEDAVPAYPLNAYETKASLSTKTKKKKKEKKQTVDET